MMTYLAGLDLYYKQKPPIKENDDVSSRPRCLKFGLNLYIHPYFRYGSSEGSGESAHMRTFLM